MERGQPKAVVPSAVIASVPDRRGAACGAAALECLQWPAAAKLRLLRATEATTKLDSNPQRIASGACWVCGLPVASQTPTPRPAFVATRCYFVAGERIHTAKHEAMIRQGSQAALPRPMAALWSELQSLPCPRQPERTGALTWHQQALPVQLSLTVAPQCNTGDSQGNRMPWTLPVSTFRHHHSCKVLWRWVMGGGMSTVTT